MRIGSLFAGIGGLETGLAQAGHEAVLTCEIWAPAVAVLAARVGVDNHPDVATLADLPGDVDLLTAGFPCQDLSQAGRTLGIEGAKSGLVGHVFRLLDRRRVPVVLLENVSFMLSLDRGTAMERLTAAFEERGYRWAYRTIDTRAFLPQRRERVFFVATRDPAPDPADILFQSDVTPPEIRTRLTTHAHGFYWTEGTRGLGWAADAVPTLKNGSTLGIPSPPAIVLPDGRIVKPDIRDSERLQGFPEGWTAPAVAVGRESLRWALVGNAVSVPVAAHIGQAIAAPRAFDRERDRPFATVRNSWPGAARYDGTTRHTVAIGRFPVFAPRPPLADFLRHDGIPLSERATAGFLARAEASRLRFAEGFLDAVRAHLSRMRNETEDARAA